MNAWKLAHVTLNDQQTESAQVSKEVDKDNSSLESTHRISKAQKRREKKAIAEKERNQRIIEQETLNIFGKRSIETEAIKEILSKQNLMIYEIPSDGHW